MSNGIHIMVRIRKDITIVHWKTLYQNLSKGKRKAVPLQAWSGPEGSSKLRFPDFMTVAQDGGKVVSLTHRPPLPPRKYTWYSFLLEAESKNLSKGTRKSTNVSIKITGLQYAAGAIIKSGDSFPICSYHST